MICAHAALAHRAQGTGDTCDVCSSLLIETAFHDCLSGSSVILVQEKIQCGPLPALPNLN